MKTRLLFRVPVVLSLLAASLPAQTAGLVPGGEAMPVESNAPAGLLQFTSGGHALGFAAGGVYAAAGDHALRVAFTGANAVQPRADSPAGDSQAVSLGRVEYPDLWDGITLAYSAAGGSIYTSTYTLAPGADPADIRLEYNAAPKINADGSLGIAFSTGALTESGPIAWQDIAGRRVAVDASFAVHGREVAFAVGAYDPGCALTIDPSLVWNTFLGGSGDEIGYGIAVDAAGNIYVAGYSDDAWGTPVRSYSANDDAFAAKLNSSGGLVWHTFLGGSGYDGGSGIAVDGSGNVDVVGWSSAGWGTPVRAHSGDYDSFVAKLNSSGALLWNSFQGGSAYDVGNGIAVDGSGNIYIAGESCATWDVPVRAYGGGYDDAFVAKLNVSSGGLMWNTFLGGSGYDKGSGIAVDGSGSVYVTGDSGATWGSPVRAFTSADAFAAKLNSSTGQLNWNTFLGGGDSDSGRGVALRGNYVYVAGLSAAAWGSPVRAFSGGQDAFAAKLDNSTGALAWNTFLGGSGDDIGNAVFTDRGGNVHVTGYSSATWGSPQRPYNAGMDAFAAKLTYAGALTVSTFLGGNGSDVGYGIAVDGSGTYITGYSILTWGSPNHALSGGDDAFVARVNLPHACPIEGQELFDFTGDCRTDVAVYRPATGAWYLRSQYSLYYGSVGDIPVPGDYNGDGITDIAVYRPSTGAWYVRNQYSAYYGQSGDIPVPGDYNGDRTTEIAVFRPSTGAWYIKGQSTVYYGASTDIPVPADYTGDGITDIAVYRPPTGAWYVRGQSSIYFGAATDIPVPGDYDGNGLTNRAVYRPSTGAWYISGMTTAYYGASDDIPVPGDYDGNGITDIAVFRPSTGAWYVRGQSTVFYGGSGDIPLPEMGTGKAGSAP